MEKVVNLNFEFCNHTGVEMSASVEQTGMNTIRIVLHKREARIGIMLPSDDEIMRVVTDVSRRN